MTKRKVVSSIHNDSADRCVDIFAHSDGRYSYKEFRRDPEDQGAWYAVGAESVTFVSQEAATEAALTVKETHLQTSVNLTAKGHLRRSLRG